MDTRKRQSGFTLIELMIVVVVIGILAAIALPNFLSMQERAKEGGTKSNMHSFQLAAEDYAIQNNSSYATDAAQVAGIMPLNGLTLVNPFTRSGGDGISWVDQPSWTVVLATGSAVSGIVAYGDTAGVRYQIAGRGKVGDFTLTLTNGN